MLSQEHKKGDNGTGQRRVYPNSGGIFSVIRHSVVTRYNRWSTLASSFQWGPLMEIGMLTSRMIKN